MRLRLSPRDTTFFDMFCQMADLLVAGADILTKMFEPGADRAALADELRDKEHEADDVTHTIMRRLNSTFVTPFDRDDIGRLAGRLDDVMDFMEAAVDDIVLYRVGTLPTEMAEQADVLQRAAVATAKAMPRLREYKNLEPYWIEVNRLENEGDQLYRRLVAKLFDEEYDAITVIKLKEVADELEAAVDAFEHVANQIETIVVKES